MGKSFGSAANFAESLLTHSRPCEKLSRPLSALRLGPSDPPPSGARAHPGNTCTRPFPVCHTPLRSLPASLSAAYPSQVLSGFFTVGPPPALCRAQAFVYEEARPQLKRG